MKDSVKNILEEIDQGKGYIVDKIDNKDLEIFENIIKKQYQTRLLGLYPSYKKEILDTEMNEYHKLKFINHIASWPKVERTFSESDILILKKSSFYKKLERKFGKIKITNEDKTRTEEIYWRLVRPNYENDVGPLHADSWFWTLHNGKIEKNLRRLKIWVSIYNQKDKNGFRLIEHSQKKLYSFRGEKRDGKMKPVFDATLEKDESLIIIPTSAGQYILFHDDLVHGGAIGGDKTRVSFEMTILIGG